LIATFKFLQATINRTSRQSSAAFCFVTKFNQIFTIPAVPITIAMNRPSRNDDAELEHPLWNQSPPFLAADLTTRQDLNGIANARVHRSGGSGAGSLSLEMLNEKHHSEGVTLQPPGPPGEKREAAIAGFQFCSDSKTAPRPLKTAAGGEGPARLTPEPRGAGIGLFRSLRAHPRDVVDTRRRRNHGNLLIWIVVLLSLGFGTYQWLQARQLESRMQLMTAQYTQGNPQNVGGRCISSSISLVIS